MPVPKLLSRCIGIAYQGESCQEGVRASAILPPADLIGAMCYATGSAQESAPGRVAKTMNVPFVFP
jgi:hypothetical protein